MPFDPAGYWNQRLTRDYSLHGVGYRGLGLPFNRWMYRVRRRVFQRAVSRAFGPQSGLRVLDLGSGTGFYVKQWKELGAHQVVGVDISDYAVAQLKQRWPDDMFICGDIGEPIPVPESTFDAVSTMDVLYHIMDDARYSQAVTTAARALRPGGFFFFTENLLRRPQQSTLHQAARTQATIMRMVTGAGLRLVRRQPMFVVMNNPVHFPALRHAWRAFSVAVGMHPAVGWTVGATLYPVELALVSLLPYGPTTELLTCIK